MNILVYGASASGKSEFAEKTAMSFNTQKLVYIAAMKPYGKEAEKRIERHRTLRSGKEFITVEQYTDIHEAVVPKNSSVLLECMSNLTANEFFREDRETDNYNDTFDRIVNGIKILSSKCRNLTIVSNDIFGAGTDYYGDTVEYMKLLGSINVFLASYCDTVYEVVYGIPVRLKG